jgi:hypothetical protein
MANDALENIGPPFIGGASKGLLDQMNLKNKQYGMVPGILKFNAMSEK